MNEEGGEAASGQKEGKSKRKKGGNRCMVMNCSSTYASNTVHTMPGPMPTGGGRFTALQMGWINFIARHRVFDHSQLKNIYVCSLHFDRSQYDQGQLRMYELGLRKLPPSLLPSSIPHIYQATATAASAEPVGVAVTQNDTPGPTSLDIPSTSSSSSSTTGTTSSDQPLVLDAEMEVETPANKSDSVKFSSAVTQSGPTIPSSSTKRKRLRTSYCRKKEVADITKEYRKKSTEETAVALAKDILERSKGHQCSVKMVHRRVGIRKRKRTCKVQVKPITVSKGKQVKLPTEQVSNLCDAVTQTEDVVMMPSVVPRQEPEGEEENKLEDAPEEEPDDEIRDPTYVPGEETNSPRKERQASSAPQNPLTEEKFIVFETNLLELFQVCLSCLSKNMHTEKICPRSYGSQLKVVATCLDCGHIREWQSQPKIGDVMAGNLLLSAAILYGGGSPTKVLRVLRHMNLKAITVQTFMDHQRDYLQPAIIRVAKEEQRKLTTDIPEGEGIVLGGDGRADSPGHCAKYGAYTLMDLKRNKIIDVQLVQSNEVSSSNAMEKEGLARGLASLQEKGVRVDTLVTDRHAQVAKWLRENHPNIKHRYDVWHIAKGLKKKINTVSKMKDCEVVGRWKRSIINHIYWCASSTQDGDGEIIAAKFKSILNHVRNIHENHGDIYPRCAHGEQYARREWMREGTKAFEKLSEELTKTRLVNDMKKMSPLEQTSSVESFHSVLLYWAPKMLAYSYAGMKCRLHLAAMHWNENAGRTQATKADGTLMYRINYPKAKEGGHTVSKVLTACTFNYVTTLMEETFHLVSGRQKIRSTLPELKGEPALCSGVQRPDKAEAVEQLNVHRRFAQE